MSLNIKNVAISSDNKVILFDATSPLENVLVDGKEIEKVELVKVFLIATAHDLIYVVKLEYLHGIGTTRQSVLEAEQLFLSFRLLSWEIKKGGTNHLFNKYGLRSAPNNTVQRIWSAPARK